MDCCTYANQEKRIYYLSDDVDNQSIGVLTYSILSAIAEDDEKDSKEKNYKREPIKLYINSYGGSVGDMWGLVDVILNSKTSIHTYCTGYAMSAGFKIFLAGHKRFCYKHSVFLYHQLSTRMSGKYLDVKQEMEETDRTQKDIEEYVLSRTKITKEKLDEIRNQKKDFYIHSEDAFTYGIVDEVL